MKFSIICLPALAITLFSCVSASPIINTKASEKPLINRQALAERSLSFPVEANDGLVASIMTSIKADLHANVFAGISTTFSEKAAASLNIQTSILGGIVKVDDVHISAIQSAAAENIKVGFEASLNAEIEAKIYAPLEVSLRESLTGQLLDEAALLNILVDLETKAKALIEIELPKIDASLSLEVEEQVKAAIHNLEVDVSLILQISITADVDQKANLDAAISVGLEACANLDAAAAASAILAVL